MYYGEKRPSTLKAYDQKGLVLYCSSFSKTLSPGLRVGWILPGVFKDQVKRLKLNTSIASPALNQLMVAEFLKSGGYDRHLRKLRSALKNQVSNMGLAIAKHFPPDTKITAPRGGLMLWVQLSPSVDGLEVFHKVMQHKISILPGLICSPTFNYRNYIRISCGSPWDESIEKGIVKLAEIVRELSENHKQRPLGQR
jgi:DNA-binding transcriptional MocR family regulator